MNHAKYLLLFCSILFLHSCTDYAVGYESQSNNLKLELSEVETYTKSILDAYYVDGNSIETIKNTYDIDYFFQNKSEENPIISSIIKSSHSHTSLLEGIDLKIEELLTEGPDQLSEVNYSNLIVLSSFKTIMAYDYPNNRLLKGGNICAAGIIGGILTGGLAGCRVGAEVGSWFASPLKGCIGGAIIGAIGGGLTGSVVGGCFDEE